MCSESRHGYGINKPSPAKREMEEGILMQKWTQFGMTERAYLLKIALCLWHDYLSLCKEDVFSPCSVSLFIMNLFVCLYRYLYLSSIWISSALMKSYILSKPYALAETEWSCIVLFNDGTCLDGDKVDKIRQDIVWWNLSRLILPIKIEFSNC